MITLTSQRITESFGRKVDSLEQSYLKYFKKFGLNLIPVPNVKEDLDFYLKLPVERIILTGGGSIGNEISKERDETEKALLDFAIKNKIPVLGICRGTQFINYYFGGKSKEIFDKSHVDVFHEIEITDEKTKNNMGNNFKINSFHDSVIDKEDISKELGIFAESSEGFVEGLYHPNLSISGIMWHPERESPNKEANEKIIKAFVNKELFWGK